MTYSALLCVEGKVQLKTAAGHSQQTATVIWASAVTGTLTER